MTYYNQLRDFVIENDEECKKDLDFWYKSENNPLTINHILAYCKNQEVCCEFYSSAITIFWEKNYKRIKIDFLKPLSEQEEACEQILNFLKG